MTPAELSEAVARALEPEPRIRTFVEENPFYIKSPKGLHGRMSDTNKVEARDLTTPEASEALVDAMVGEGWNWQVDQNEVGAIVFFRQHISGSIYQARGADPKRRLAILKAAYEALKAIGRIEP